MGVITVGVRDDCHLPLKLSVVARIHMGDTRVVVTDCHANVSLSSLFINEEDAGHRRNAVRYAANSSVSADFLFTRFEVTPFDTFRTY